DKLELEMQNMELKVGDKLKIKGMILHDADRFQIDLGSDREDLALHFNPKRKMLHTVQKGSEVKVGMFIYLHYRWVSGDIAAF
uniref:Galectin n=1 Tax=Neogobius melanostomus TaxID=47308 RepID=A0A8C6SYL0_9GOBI